ncbi:hypothetical protein OG21DRAFT_807562 [Imleria badia]|nr:hypothetical protein OG21DRAFT_807562 [Imleria badia]
MIHVMSVILYLAHTVQGTSTTCPPSDGTPRSVWSILATCAFTLLICVWQSIHDDVPPPNLGWCKARVVQVSTILLSFLLPEWTVCIAGKQWSEARRKAAELRDKRYGWSMTHSFFAEMGGFYYCKKEGSSERIDSLDFKALRDKDEIANPDFTEQDIKDKSKSDWPGKFILGVQLIWFILQVAVRHFTGLAVTLVELDTVCMAVLTILLLYFWHYKPLRPKCPHIFYSYEYLKSNPDLSQASQSGRCFLYALTDFVGCTGNTPADEEKPLPENRNDNATHSLWHSLIESVKMKQVDTSSISLGSLCTAWFIFGALHLTAWDFAFAMKLEKFTWRIGSLLLAAAPLVVTAEKGLVSVLRRVGWRDDTNSSIESTFLFFSLALAFVCRMLLVVVMFASLRFIPCSAYETVSWLR